MAQGRWGGGKEGLCGAGWQAKQALKAGSLETKARRAGICVVICTWRFPVCKQLPGIRCYNSPTCIIVLVAGAVNSQDAATHALHIMTGIRG